MSSALVPGLKEIASGLNVMPAAGLRVVYSVPPL